MKPKGKRNPIVLYSFVAILVICSLTLIVLKITTQKDPASAPAITCAEIVGAHEGATDLKWQNIENGVYGHKYWFSGKVDYIGDWSSAGLVRDGYCSVVIHSIPPNIFNDGAIGGHYLEGWGIVKKISWSGIFADIDLNVIDHTITIR
jgi:hypothetical protein